MKNKLLFLALSLLLVSQLFLQDAFSQTPVVRVTPTSILSPAAGQTFKVKVAIENGQNVAGYQVMLEYNPAVLQLVSYIRRGDYLPAGAFYGRARTKPIKWSPPGSIIQFTKKRLQFAATSSPNESQKSGGTLVTFTFRLLSGKAALNFVPGTRSDKTGTLLANKNGTLMFPRLVNWGGFGTTPPDSAEPSGIIQQVAVGPNSTYFIFPTKPPNRGAGVVHREYKVTVHIPNGVRYYMFPIPQPEDKQQAALEAGINLVLCHI